MNTHVSIVEVINIIKRKLWLILSLCFLGFLGAWVANRYIIQPVYESSAEILVSRADPGGGVDVYEIDMNVRIINTYKDLLQGPVVLNDVQGKLGGGYTAEGLAGMIDITANPGSQVFSIVVQAGDPQEAATIANEVANTFHAKIGDLMKLDNVFLVSEAVPKANPVAPNKQMNLLIGTVAGLFLGLLITFAIHYFDNTVKDTDYLMEKYHWANLGEIMNLKDHTRKNRKREGSEKLEDVETTRTQKRRVSI